eukprot:CAMPEP_0174261444 /NCGR_PEP_ID=MMETSP0439-20130205/11436_1 /TAXON_ID=0 /ORGANISM="Stereomyxa ramosa, Strain Chinc5" /LENGTH=321 /DNA_ID=CAMNT_0015345923 /DNA_START=41 /DNA_END=1003 /DNA_ORIENTATION=+
MSTPPDSKKKKRSKSKITSKTDKTRGTATEEEVKNVHGLKKFKNYTEDYKFGDITRSVIRKGSKLAKKEKKTSGGEFVITKDPEFVFSSRPETGSYVQRGGPSPYVEGSGKEVPSDQQVKPGQFVVGKGEKRLSGTRRRDDSLATHRSDSDLGHYVKKSDFVVTDTNLGAGGETYTESTESGERTEENGKLTLELESESEGSEPEKGKQRETQQSETEEEVESESEEEECLDIDPKPPSQSEVPDEDQRECLFMIKAEKGYKSDWDGTMFIDQWDLIPVVKVDETAAWFYGIDKEEDMEGWFPKAVSGNRIWVFNPDLVRW